MLSTAVAHTSVVCAANEFVNFPPPSGQTCGEYMSAYMNATGSGYLVDAAATTECSFCQIDNTDTFLAMVSAHPDKMWRNFGLMWVYIAFNVAGAIFFYWLVRVPKKRGKGKKELPSPKASKEGSISEEGSMTPDAATPRGNTAVTTTATSTIVEEEKSADREKAS